MCPSMGGVSCAFLTNSDACVPFFIRSSTAKTEDDLVDWLVGGLSKNERAVLLPFPTKLLSRDPGGELKGVTT